MGCGSQHLPFGDLDAQKTAAYVARRAVSVLQGAVQDGELLSWKGPADAFRAAEFHTTPRYDLSEFEERLPGAAVARTACLVCGTS